MSTLDPMLDALRGPMVQLQTLIDATGHDEGDTRAAARLLLGRLQRLDETLRGADARVALIGPPGIGKSAALASLAGLYTDGRPKSVDAQRETSLLTIGSGRSTAFPLLVRPPRLDEPQDKITLSITPMDSVEVDRLVQDVAAAELKRRRDADDPTDRPDPMSEELRNAVLNAAGYGERTVVTYERNNLKRARRERPLDAVITRETTLDALSALLKGALGERRDDRWTFTDDAEGRKALKEQLRRINVGEAAGAALPDYLALALPVLPGQPALTLIDTRGLDGPLAVRGDLRELLEDPLVVPVLCAAFNNAPGEDLLVALRALHDDPALRPALRRTVVLLIDKGEAAAVVGADGDRLVGQALKLGQCEERLPSYDSPPLLVTAYDSLKDDPPTLLELLSGRVAETRQALITEAERALHDAERLCDGNLRTLSAALDEQLQAALRAHPIAEAPSLDPPALLSAPIRACPFALRIRATLKRQGEFKNLNLFDAVAGEARAAAERWLAPVQRALLAQLQRLEEGGEHDEDLLNDRRAQITLALEQTARDYGEAVRGELRARLKNDPVWEAASAEYSNGPGFREKSAALLDRWGAQQTLVAHRQTRLVEHLPLYGRVLAPEEAPGFTLTVENLRRARALRWSLKGVNLLIGANGAGKSTAISALRFFAEALRDGPGPACARLGAARTLRSWGAPPDAPILLSIERGESCWSFTLTPRDTDRAASWRESLTHQGVSVLDVDEAGRLHYRGADLGMISGTTGLMHLLRMQKMDLPLTRIAELAQGIRAYRTFNLHQLRAGGTTPLPERRLEDDGGNAFAALLALKNAPGGQERYDLVIDTLRQAFPALIEELSLRLTEHSVEALVTAPGGSPPLYIGQQADGLLHGLVTLVAIADASPGDVIALDQPEDGLHPWALKVLLSSLEDWAWRHRLTVIIATHSLVLLDAMGGAPERVFVMKAHKVGEPSPAPLTALYDRDWLQGFTLGDLYAESNIGSNGDEP